MSLTRHVVIPVDFSSLSLRAVAGLKTIGTSVAHITALHVLDTEATEDTHDIAPAMPHAREKLRKILEGRLNDWCAEHLADFANVSKEVLVGDSPAEAICRRAKEIGSSLIVITTHGRTGLAHLVMGSVAEGVVQKAPCATLVIPRH